MPRVAQKLEAAMLKKSSQTFFFDFDKDRRMT